MLAKKGLSPTSPSRMNRKELDYLYARRSAIDSLIQSLEEYNRFRARQLEEPKRKSA
jgi:hypothetical protein